LILCWARKYLAQKGWNISEQHRRNLTRERDLWEYSRGMRSGGFFNKTKDDCMLRKIENKLRNAHYFSWRQGMLNPRPSAQVEQ